MPGASNDPQSHGLLVGIGNGAFPMGVLAPGAAGHVPISDGTDWASRALLPADISGLLSAPGVIGAVTPAAATFTVLTVTGKTHLQDDVDLAEGKNLLTGTTTGTQFGTVGGAVGQKMAWWGKTPIVQPVLATGGGATADNIITVLQNLGFVRQS